MEKRIRISAAALAFGAAGKRPMTWLSDRSSRLPRASSWLPLAVALLPLLVACGQAGQTNGEGTGGFFVVTAAGNQK